MIAESTINAVKAAVNVVEVVQGYLKLKKQGSEFVALCPFHGEKTPSFKVSPAKQIYTCFGCGKSGDAISFVMEYEKKTYTEAIEILAKQYNITFDQKSPTKKKFEKPLPRLEKVSKPIIEYFEKRGISNNTLLRFNITEAKEWMPKAQKEVNAICFNYYRNGELINIKFRAKDKDFKLAKDAELIFYNLDAIQGLDECIIVEGEIDCLTNHECLLHNTISVPNGTTPKGEMRLEYLDNCWQDLQHIKRFILMTDGDETGKRLRDELARRLGYEKCYQVQYPAGCKDINEVLVKHGKEAVKKVYDEATLWPLESILTMFDMMDDVMSIYENGYPHGYKVPLPGIIEASALELMLGQFTTVTGIPGSGKSEFVDWLMVGMAKDHQWGWGVCSAENQPPTFHVTKLIEKFAGKSFIFRKNPEHRIPRGYLGTSMQFIEDNFYFIKVDEVEMTLEGILEKARELVLRKGIRGLLIDPWNRVENKRQRGQSETDYINWALTKISSFAKLNQIHIVIVAHPIKMSKDKKTGQYEIPGMYHISGSSHWFNQTDVGITVYRDYKDNVVDVYIQKVRYSWLGHQGFATYKYDTDTRQYEHLGTNGSDRVKKKAAVAAAAAPTQTYSVLPVEKDGNFDDGFGNNTDDMPF